MCEVQAKREPLVGFAARASWTSQILTGRYLSSRYVAKSLQFSAPL